MIDYLYLKDSLYTFRQNYNFLKIFSIGKSVLNNEIYCIKLCNAFVSNSQIYGYDAKYLYENCSLYIIPMINPDGINLVNNFYTPSSEVYISTHNIAKNFPDIPFPSGWKANINDVVLNNYQPFCNIL